MVSQSSYVGYTIMGKTADLTVVQKTTIDTLHKEGKTQKVMQKRLAVHRAVSKHINREAKGRKRCGRKKCTSNRDNRTLERIVKQNPFKNVGEIHKEWTAAEVSASRTTTHRRMQDMGFKGPCQATLEQQTAVRSVSPGLKTKRTGLLLSGPKLCSQMKVNFAFPLEIRVPQSGGREERHRIPLLEVQCKFPQSVMVWGAMSSAGVGPCVFWGPRSTQPYTRKF